MLSRIIPSTRFFAECARWCFACVLAVTVALAAGCGDDDNPADPGDDGGDTTTVGIGRGTIDSLLTLYFPEHYSNRDSLEYDEMLDARYTFKRLPDDPDDPVEDMFWDKTEEMRIAGRMFGEKQNVDGKSVASIRLNINVGLTTASQDPEEPAGEEWFDVDAIIDMIVVLNDPTQPDQSGILNLIINSKQKFVVTRDADDPGDWVIVKQADQDSINKAGVASVTEDASWSDLKDLFR